LTSVPRRDGDEFEPVVMLIYSTSVSVDGFIRRCPATSFGPSSPTSGARSRRSPSARDSGAPLIEVVDDGRGGTLLRVALPCGAPAEPSSGNP
jgi:hypothetical protein